MNFTRNNHNTLSLLRKLINNTNRNKATSTAEYCIESVKRYDYENFMCTLLLKDTARSCAFAVRSFNVEVARVGEQVSDSKIGLMRLKFWEDTISSCFANDVTKIPQQPVAAELYKAIKRSKLSKRYFNSLIASRRENLTVTAFPNLEEMEKYLEKSVSNVYYLILEGSNVRNVNADHAASHLGKAQGLVQQLRSAALARKLNVIPFPQDILAKNKVSHEEILRSVSSERLNECAFEIASRAHQHLVKARSLLKDIPAEGRAALLPAVIVANYLEKLQKLHYNVLHPSLQKRSWNWLPRLWLKNFQNKY